MDNFFDLFGSPSCSVESRGNELPASLPPEIEEGNIEYKLKLVNPTSSRLEHLTTQMKWRLREGKGEAIYEIGVEDNGVMTGLTPEDLKSSLDTLQKMATKLFADLTILREKTVDVGPDLPSRHVAEVLVRKIPDNQEFLDVRVAVLGNVDSGKSTMLGVLTYGELDNGHGRARLNLFRHLHEIQTGRTSSISHEIMGFDKQGEVLNYSESRTAEDIIESAAKIISFIDLAGHQKYMKTTIFGLTGYCPDYVMLVISGNAGIVGTTKEHLGLCMALSLPVFVVINKVDVCNSSMVSRLTQQLEKILKSPACGKLPLKVTTDNDVFSAAANFLYNQITPIFTVSCVTGSNLNLLRRFLNLVPPVHSKLEQEKLAREHVEFQIDEVFTVPGTGPVACGTLTRGILHENEQLVIGPGVTGKFIPCKIHSVQRNRTACRLVRAGQSASVALEGIERPLLRKGMVIVDPTVKPQASLLFDADIFLLFHTTTIATRFQTTVHIENVIQTAVIVDMNRDSVKTGQRAKVRFKFIKQPEFIRCGSKMLFRQGRTKGVGKVISVYPYIPQTTHDT